MLADMLPDIIISSYFINRQLKSLRASVSVRESHHYAIASLQFQYLKCIQNF